MKFLIVALGLCSSFAAHAGQVVCAKYLKSICNAGEGYTEVEQKKAWPYTCLDRQNQRRSFCREQQKDTYLSINIKESDELTTDEATRLTSLKTRSGKDQNFVGCKTHDPRGAEASMNEPATQVVYSYFAIVSSDFCQ